MAAQLCGGHGPTLLIVETRATAETLTSSAVVVAHSGPRAYRQRALWAGGPRPDSRVPRSWGPLFRAICAATRRQCRRRLPSA